MYIFYQLSVIEFGASVFEAILSIEKCFNLIEYRELIVKNSPFIMYAGVQI